MRKALSIVAARLLGFWALLLATAWMPGAVLAQPEVPSGFAPGASWAWSSNTGWVNFRQGSNGVAVYERYLGGHAWDQNTGWILFGDGAPANGHSYANNGPSDYGVNMDALGCLSGFAWSPNVGWITFEQTHGLPRIDLGTGMMSGYAWSQNVGWINLGEAMLAPTVVAITAQDGDADGIEDSYESFHFGGLGVANAMTDADKDGVLDADEALADSDPNDPADRFRILQIVPQPDPGGKGSAGSQFLIEWKSSPRRHYVVAGAGEPASGFTEIPGTETPGSTGATTSMQVEGDAVTRRGFWQVKVMRPFSSPPISK